MFDFNAVWGDIWVWIHYCYYYDYYFFTFSNQEKEVGMVDTNATGNASVRQRWECY